MARPSRRWRLAGLLILAGVLTTGCSLPSMAYFLVTGFQEPMEEPGDMKLASAEHGKEVKALILTYAAIPMRPEILTIEQDLSGYLVRQLQQSCKDNREKVVFIPPGKVQEYKNQHHDWYLKPEAVGKHFNADKVVYLEIGRLSLYERGNQLYCGRTSISVKLFDLTKPEEWHTENTFAAEYPPSGRAISVDDKSPHAFYLEFLGYIVKHLSWYFTAHPVSESVGAD